MGRNKYLKNILIAPQILYFYLNINLINILTDTYIKFYYIIFEYIKIFNSDFSYLKDINKKEVSRYS